MTEQTIPSAPSPILPTPSRTLNAPYCKYQTPLYLIVGVLILVILSGLTYLFQTQNQSPAPVFVVTMVTPTPTVNPTTAWKTYTNTKYQFQFNYPDYWKILSVDNSIDYPPLTPTAFPYTSNNILFGFGKRNPDRSTSKQEQMYTFVTDNPKRLKLKDYFIDQKWGNEWLKLMEYTTINDYEAVNLQFSGSPSGYYINSGKYIVNLRFSYDEVNDKFEVPPQQTFDQILSTFRFLDNNQPSETIKAIDVFPPENIPDDVRQYLGDSVWPKLKPFKVGDQTREVYLVNCQVDNSPNGISLVGNVASIPNITNIAEATLKELTSRHYGGFPNQEEIKSYLAYGGNFKNTDSGINGVILKPDGTLVINFYDAVRAYGGGSSRVGCMRLSVDLTMKQFPSIKKTVMCIDKYAQNTNDCYMDFQP